MQVLEKIEAVLRIVVRIVGIVLVLVGSWIGLSAVEEAWNLYRDPGRVERFALAIEQGSGIDSTLAGASAGAGDKRAGFRPSYFLSWTIAILLLLLIARVAIWTIATGGRLTLREARSRVLTKELEREMARGRER